MPFNYSSPGIYVEEINTGARPIESAATAVLAMIGMTREVIEVQEVGKENPVPHKTPLGPTLVTNWTQFINTYGDWDQRVPYGFLHDAMYGFFLNGGTAAYVVGIPVPVAEPDRPSEPQLGPGEAFLAGSNGLNAIHLITPGPLKPGDQINVEVAAPGEGAPPNTFNLVITHGTGEPKVVPNLAITKGEGDRNIADVLVKETDNLLRAEVISTRGNVQQRLPAVGTKVALVPPAQPQATAAQSTDTALVARPQVTPDLFRGSLPEGRGLAALEAIDEVTLVACPDIIAAFQNGAANEEDVRAVQTAILNHCDLMKNRFAILDCPPGFSVQDIKTWRSEKMNFDSKYGALYYPWIRVDGRLVPPSGHLAGVYARVDAERGVHKAPANEIIRGAIGLERNISRNEQDRLNPYSVNCIRTFPNQGIRIWGARTLSNDAQWRYINVRRLFNNVEESLLRSTSWIVFEPNDIFLWNAIKRDVGAYLTNVWRSGALFGNTPQEAFYVKCDAETNPPELRDLGYCIIEIGMAPVKPAEFIIFRVGQKADAATVSEKK